MVELERAAWNDAVSAPDPIVWFSRRSAHEMCGFLELVSRRGHRRIRIVDVADVEFRDRNGRLDPYFSTHFALVSDTRIVEHGLVERARSLSVGEIASHIETWRRIEADNTPLRVATSTGIASVPLTHFDAMIVACADSEWKRGARVVGAMLERQRVSDEFLWSRIRSLVADKRLEGRGDLTSMRHSEIRRASTE